MEGKAQMTKGERTKQEAQRNLERLFNDLLNHNGFAELRIEMRLLKRGQKEVIIYCGKQYRYVVDYAVQEAPATPE
jgi:hypothetical protein